jgi:hypothetical protein
LAQPGLDIPRSHLRAAHHGGRRISNLALKYANGVLRL